MYWHVHLGLLDRLNGPASYPFPTEIAAVRFAQAAKRLAAEHVWTDIDGTIHVGVDRDVDISCPDGRQIQINLPTLGDIEDQEGTEE